VILLGGMVEIVGIRRNARRFDQETTGSTLAAWVLRLQGNLSFVAIVLSALLVWQDLAWVLPGLWLLLLGHSFYMLGGLAFPPFRTCGLLYQLGGLVALWPNGNPLLAFAAATAVGNLWMGIGILRAQRGGYSPSSSSNG
jgi:hypothetical protein